jgi:hypothetical protein
MFLVVVMIDPHGEAISEPIDEGLGGALEAHPTRTRGRERHVEDDDAPLQIGWLGKLSRCAIGHEGKCHWPDSAQYVRPAQAERASRALVAIAWCSAPVCADLK